tara:strand:- start:271 stop:801 length:531 start_codon:yes stop_codon:yes gene_type:complete
MQKTKYNIHLKEKIVTLLLEEFDSDVDVDELVKIHYDNMLGELLTVSSLMNKVGWLKADAHDSVREAKLQLEIHTANIKEKYRKEAVKIVNEKSKAPTKDEVDNSVYNDKRYLELRHSVLRLEKEYEYIDAFYWGVKSKDQKLNRIADQLKPEEYRESIVEGSVNGVMIKLNKNKF